LQGFPAAEELLERAGEAVRSGREDLLKVLDQLPSAIYVTDAEGLITYFNPACAPFTGRDPKAGEDRWCVTWRLYTDQGSFLPHDQCPMAVAIREGRPIRGVSAVAERPDGTRVAFVPFPTPIFDADGQLMGAVNMLVEAATVKRSTQLLGQAARCRRLAKTVDGDVSKVLMSMADDYEREGLASMAH
jgi:PAS domain-containing protein